VSRYRSKHVLAVMYASRVVLIGAYLLMPPSALTFYVFAAGLGFTWLATVPPTASLVGKLFGVRYLGTLFGLTLLSHQIGGFLGAWLGGLAVVEFGNYSWMWYADMALAAMAALVNLPIREARVERLALAGWMPGRAAVHPHPSTSHQEPRLTSTQPEPQAVLYFDVISPWACLMERTLQQDPLPVALERRPVLLPGSSTPSGTRGRPRSSASAA
jgi:hypothetical protein